MQASNFHLFWLFCSIPPVLKRTPYHYDIMTIVELVFILTIVELLHRATTNSGKDEREEKNNALAGSIATFHSRQLVYTECCAIKTMVFIHSH